MLRKFSNSPQREFFLSQYTDPNAFKLEMNTILEKDKEKSNLMVLNLSGMSQLSGEVNTIS